MTKALLKKIKMYVKPKYLIKSRVKWCCCCEKKTLHLRMNESDEFYICLRCKANIRYDKLAECINELGDLSDKVIVEFDTRSPLYNKLKKYDNYTRTFFNPEIEWGHVQKDGTRCEDITAMTFDNESVDLMISSDVLEHVTDVEKAFSECERVLKSGGKHIFTIPMYDGDTRRRAIVENGEIKHLLPEHYHCDPSGNGFILAFYDFGMDLAEKYSTDKLKISVLKGPFGDDGKIVWCAEKL